MINKEGIDMGLLRNHGHFNIGARLGDGVVELLDHVRIFALEVENDSGFL